MTAHRFLEPLDVLFLRGNKLFGDAGSYGEALIPPWPSVAAGALRSRMLVDAGIDPARFARGEVNHPELGTPKAPGPFRLIRFQPARRREGHIEPLYPLPADCLVTEREKVITVHRLQPRRLDPAIDTAWPESLPYLPVLATDRPAKPESGYWLNPAGWRAWQNGEEIAAAHLVHSRALWTFDGRIGVGLDEPTRSAAEGRLFTVQGIAMKKDVGFLAAVAGAEPPTDGLLRLGGDGRGAAVHAVEHIDAPEADLDAIVRVGRARIILLSPGLFPQGWRLPGMAEDGRFTLHGVRGRVVAAAVGRAEVVSGWDLARWQPKTAQRAAPTGSVYWIEELEATPEALGAVVTRL